jgi:hypothetical protein
MKKEMSNVQCLVLCLAWAWAWEKYTKIGNEDERNTSNQMEALRM